MKSGTSLPRTVLPRKGNKRTGGEKTENRILQRGTGRDLLFLHGYGARKECFLPQINHFSRFCRVTAFDFTGFGDAPPLSDAWAVEDYAEETRRLVRSLSLQRPHVVAHSFGARVAVKIAAADENFFDKIVLTGAAGIVPRRTIGYRFKVGAYRLVRRFFPVYAERHFGSAEYRALSPVMRESYKKIVNEDLRAAAAEIQNPVLLIFGDEDRDTPPAAGEIYRAAIQGSRLEILPGCGHFVFLDDPLSFNALVEEFLQL